MLLSPRLQKLNRHGPVVRHWMVFLKTRPFVKWNNAEFTNLSSFTSLRMCSTHFTLSLRILLFSLQTTNSVQNWEVSEECTQSDHSLILFDLRIQRNNKNLKRMASDFTRKFSTQVGNWNLFQLKVKKCSQQWRDRVNSTMTKEKKINLLQKFGANWAK